MDKYEWKEGSRFPVKADVAGAELDRIRVKHGDELAPRTVVNESRPAKAPLHPCFEWDDSKAADLWRDDQASRIIRSVRVIHEPPSGEPPAPVVRYVPVNVADDRRAYVTTARAMSDKEMRQQVLGEALSQLRGWRQRYSQLTELKDVFSAIDRLAV